ncbi:hypothetical protein D3C78_1746080 [compost metagenome]
MLSLSSDGQRSAGSGCLSQVWEFFSRLPSVLAVARIWLTLSNSAGSFLFTPT